MSSKAKRNKTKSDMILLSKISLSSNEFWDFSEIVEVCEYLKILTFIDFWVFSDSVSFCWFQSKFLSPGVVNITALVLNMTGFVLNMTGLVLNMTTIVLNMNGFDIFFNHMSPAQPGFLV